MALNQDNIRTFIPLQRLKQTITACTLLKILNKLYSLNFLCELCLYSTQYLFQSTEFKLPQGRVVVGWGEGVVFRCQTVGVKSKVMERKKTETKTIFLNIMDVMDKLAF